MTYGEIIFDGGIYLFFFIFGLISGLFVMWLEMRQPNLGGKQ